VELETIEEFGSECKSAFKRMVEGMRKEEEKANGGKKEPELWEEFELVEKKPLTKRTSLFVLQAVGKGEGEELDPGAFAIEAAEWLDPTLFHRNTHRIELGIALDEASRGCSRYLHERLKQARRQDPRWKDYGKCSYFRSIFKSHFRRWQYRHYCFPVPHRYLLSNNFNYELHYAVRSADDTSYKNLLEKMGTNVQIYDKSKGDRMNISKILEDHKWNSYVYVCGPQRMIADSVRTANACGMSQDEIHYEAFQIATSEDPFTAELAKSKKKLQVGADQTLLEVMRAAGLEVGSSCETGNCGTCKVEVCSGKVEHRGSALSEEDKQGGKRMLSCVSRGISHLVIDF
jgi:ferredoxin